MVRSLFFFLLICLFLEQSTTANQLETIKSSEPRLTPLPSATIIPLPKMANTQEEMESVLVASFRDSCQTGDLEKFETLSKNFKKKGYYIPLVDGKPSPINLKWMMGHLAEKNSWLNGLIKKLKKTKKLSDVEFDIDRLETLLMAMQKVRYHLEIKLKWKISSDQSLKEVKDKSLKKQITHALKEAKQLNKQFKSLFKKMLSRVFYLKNFHFPVDHLKNRLDFEQMQQEFNKLVQSQTALSSSKDQKNQSDNNSEDKKNKSNLKNKKTILAEIEKNKFYLKRKIFEDGAPTLDETSSDLFLRTSLDTFQLTLNETDLFFSEGLILDWQWLSPKLLKMQKQGLHYWQQRIGKWEEKNNFLLTEYKELLKQANKPEVLLKKNNSLAEDSLELQQFVLERLKKIYKFWAKRSLKEQQVMVLATILTHEVGSLDPEKMYRPVVIDVVMNRSEIASYSRLSELDLMKDEQDQRLWLNLLFKKGEFSFTYFFMPSVKEFFCPLAFTGVKTLMLENAKLAWENLLLKANEKNVQNQATAVDALKVDILKPISESPKWLRYFSRVSMVGRIDISKWWVKDHLIASSLFKGPLYEEAMQGQLKESFKKNEWMYLYQEQDPEGHTYSLWQKGDQRVVLDLEEKGEGTQEKFYHYLNPHLFKFFAVKKLQ